MPRVKETPSAPRKLNVCIIHLDLGIGGAERLIVNCASGLKSIGHNVEIFTSHHDPSRCFEETAPSGILGNCIRVHCDWMPRQILGGFTALCAMWRMFGLALVVAWRVEVPDVLIIDGVSFPVPLLKIANIPVLFYCHYPDKLLCVERANILKRCYRYFIDYYEEITTGCADVIVVNSKFTTNAFAKAFPILGSHYTPQVLYPSIDIPALGDMSGELTDKLKEFDFVFTSINRYERKKNILLALQACHQLLQRTEHRVLLVIAGGYDVRVAENVQYYEELVAFAETKNMSSNVLFLRSISDAEKTTLLRHSTAVLYTPANEHFGIVPVEAMSVGTPVIAVSSGGPLETVMHEKTGFLCDESPEAFADVMARFFSKKLRATMSKNGIKHVKDNFTNDAMTRQLEVLLKETTDAKHNHADIYMKKIYTQLSVLMLVMFNMISAIVKIWSYYRTSQQLQQEE